MARRFAQDTEVAIARSREQINEILRRWGCLGIAWMDEFEEQRICLQFKWPRERDDGQVTVFLASISVQIESEDEVRARCMGARGLREAQFEKELDRRGRREHRVLHLWIKAAFEAVEEGIVDAEAIFLPFLVAKDGRTVYDNLSSSFDKLLTVPANRLLGAG